MTNYRQTTAEAYDGFVSTYVRENEEGVDRKMGPIFKARLKTLMQLAEWSTLQGKKALEVGCGTGRDIEEFKLEGLTDYLGLELSNEMLNLASSRHPDFNFQQRDFYEYPYPEETYDLIWASAALLHLTPDEALETIRNFYKALKPGGTAMISMRIKMGRDDKEPGMMESEKQGVAVQRYLAFYTIEEFALLIHLTDFDVLDLQVERDVEGQSVWMYFYLAKI